MPQRIIFVRAILVILLAAVSSGARTSYAAEGCAGKPGSTAPQGEHWYYRLDRTLHRPCWYLGPEGTRVTQAGARRARSAGRVGGPRPARLAAAGAPAEGLHRFPARARGATGRNGSTPRRKSAAPGVPNTQA